MTQAEPAKERKRTPSTKRPLKAVGSDDPAATSEWDARRAEIIRAATGLFLRKGFAQTSMSDVGALVGMSGPALYHYFSGKNEIVAIASAHAGDRLRDDIIATQRLAPKAALNALIESYVSVTVEEPTFIAVWLRDRHDIEPVMGNASPVIQRQYIDGWILTLGRVRPKLRHDQLRVLIHAALGAINSIALYRPDTDEAELKAMLVDVAQSIVHSPVGDVRD
jgi:AcrR family transcriptional regulator